MAHHGDDIDHRLANPSIAIAPAAHAHLFTRLSHHRSALRPADMVSLAAELGYGYVGCAAKRSRCTAAAPGIGDAVACAKPGSGYVILVSACSISKSSASAATSMRRVMCRYRGRRCAGAHSLLVAADDPDQSWPR